MQNPESQQIVARFFAALAALKAARVIRGKQTFTRRYDINRWNMNTLEKKPESDMFQMAWLTYLVNDYGVSSSWLLTGKGEMFVKKKSLKNEFKAVLDLPARSGDELSRCKTPISRKMERWDCCLFAGLPG